MARPLRSTSALVPSRLVEVPVPAVMAGLAVCSWECHPGTARTFTVLPDGCVDLTWDGTRLNVTGAAATVVRHEVASTVVGVRLRSGSAGRALGVPAHLLPADGVELGALWGAATRAWEWRLGEASDEVEARHVLQSLIAFRLEREVEPDGLVRQAVSALGVGHGVDEAARRVAVSGRELRRRCRREVGIGPKALHRVLRFRRYFAALGPVALGEVSLADVAVGLGYVDQAHLARECRALSGSTPTGLARRWAQHEFGRNVQDGAAASRAP